MKQLSSDLEDTENDNKRLTKEVKILQNSISSLKSVNQELLEVVKLAPKNDIRIQTAMHNLGKNYKTM